MKAALEAGQTLAETFGNALNQMVKDGKRTPVRAALSKEMFPFLDDPNVRAALAQCAQQHGAVDFSILSWVVPSAHAQTGCAIPINGQIKYFSPTQAGTCLTDYDQLTGVVRGMISATGVTIAGLAGAFLWRRRRQQERTLIRSSLPETGALGDQPIRQILVTYPDGTTANLTIETYDDGGAVRLTSGTIGTLPMTPSQLKDTGYVLTNAGIPSVVISASSNNSPPVPGASPGEETKGRTSQWEKPGGMLPYPDCRECVESGARRSSRAFLVINQSAFYRRTLACTSGQVQICT